MEKAKSVGVFLIFLCLLVFVWFPKSEAIAAPIQLKTAHAYPSGVYQMNVIHEYWKEAVEKYTDGRVKVTIYPMAQLYPAKEEIAACSLGSVDFVTTPNVYLSAMFRPIRILEFPFLFEDTDHFWRFYKMERNRFDKLYAEKGIKYLGETGYPGYGIWNRQKPINKMEDWKGLKMRAGGIQKLCIEAWGASGVMIEPAELPTALQQGMVDGGIHTPSLVADTPLYPYLKYGSSPFKYIFYASVPQLMSLKTWNSLPPEIQKIIETRVSDEIVERSIKLDLDATGAKYKKIESGGVKLSWFDPGEIEKMQSKFKPVLEKHLSDMGPGAAELYEVVIRTRRIR